MVDTLVAKVLPLRDSKNSLTSIEAEAPHVTPETNPWLPQEPEPAVAEAPAEATVAATGPVRPQKGVPAPDLVDQLPVRRVDRLAALWVVGAHGGAGESTISDLDDSWAAARHVWPVAPAGEPARVVVVARTSARGLRAAQSAAKQWAAGLVGGVELLGLVLVADAPGRLPRPLRDLAKVVGGGYPRTWNIPWIESWRLGEQVSTDIAVREVRRLVDDLRTLLPPGASSGAATERN